MGEGLFAAAMVVLGAALAWFFGTFQETRRDGRLRASLATALLAELRWARAVLVKMSDDPTYASSLELPVLDTAIVNITVFPATTTHELTGFLTNLRRLREEMVLKREPAAIRILAAIAVSKLPTLCGLLRSDGGLMPEVPELEPLGVADIPRLIGAPNPFGGPQKGP